MSNRAEKRAAAYIRKVRREDRMADKKSLQRMAADLTEKDARIEKLEAMLNIAINWMLAFQDEPMVGSEHAELVSDIARVRAVVQQLKDTSK